MKRGILNFSLVPIAMLLAATAASAQDGTVAIDAPDQKLVPGPVTRVTEIQERLASLKGAIKDAAAPLPEGQTRSLGGVIMQVKGRCQWRIDEKSSWKKAAINDSLRPGAWIRTGLNSILTLRCGLNSTVMVDSNSRVQLPQLMQDGDVLRTVVTVNRGRADIQVDRVGLINDFSVLTPSGSLAVKGTGMGVQYDGFTGTTVVGARHNRMNAIEMRYFAREGYAWLMSGGAVSTQSVPNPATVAALETQPTPSLQAYEAEDLGSFDSAADQAMSATDTATATTRIVLAQEQQRVTNSILTGIEQEVIAGILSNQEALLLAAAQEAQAAALAGLLQEEVFEEIIEEIIEEELEEIIDSNIDDIGDIPDDPHGDDPILELDGYRSYFNAMNSPSDQGFLAATLVLDLWDAGEPLGDFTGGIPVDVPIGTGGTQPRRQIPHILEAGLFADFGGNSGARDPLEIPTGYAPLPIDGPLAGMYAQMLQYGRDHQQWFTTGGTAPTQADMESMVQIYENYLQGNPTVFVGAPNVELARTHLTASLQALYQTNLTPGFTPYGQALLNNYVPTHVVPLHGGGNYSFNLVR